MREGEKQKFTTNVANVVINLNAFREVRVLPYAKSRSRHSFLSNLATIIRLAEKERIKRAKIESKRKKESYLAKVWRLKTSD